MLSRRDFGALLAAAQSFPDIRSVPADLVTPEMIDAAPAAGRRVRHTLHEYDGTSVHHALYLPSNWNSDRRFPVIVEYAGNGNYQSPFGDVSTGRVEGSNLGYGISGGFDFIWIGVPCVNKRERRNEAIWWGDADATADYCRKAVERVCYEYRGDPNSVILTGFSRGAIACNYIGLRNDAIARQWLAFVPFSHYDGVSGWEYPASDRFSALQRLRRLNGRAQFICHEQSVEDTRQYLSTTGVRAPFAFQAVNFRNHSDAWVLRDVPERRVLREWISDVLKRRPGQAAS